MKDKHQQSVGITEQGGYWVAYDTKGIEIGRIAVGADRGASLAQARALLRTYWKHTSEDIKRGNRRWKPWG